MHATPWAPVYHLTCVICRRRFFAVDIESISITHSGAFPMARALEILGNAALVMIASLCLVLPAFALDEQMPQLVTKNGRHAFMVDGKPFLLLAAQANNSSNYPIVLKDVWPAVEKMHANTLEIPVAWEQVEPVE